MIYLKDKGSHPLFVMRLELLQEFYQRFWDSFEGSSRYVPRDPSRNPFVNLSRIFDPMISSRSFLDSPLIIYLGLVLGTPQGAPQRTANMNVGIHVDIFRGFFHEPSIPPGNPQGVNPGVPQ